MPVVHPEKSGWDGGGDKMQPPTGGDCACQAPGHLSCLDLGRAQNAGPTESAPLWSTRVPEPERLRPGKCIQPRAGLSSQQSNLEPKQYRQGKHTRREWGQTQCGRDTASTCQCYLFEASLPHHSMTEQVSLKKCPPPPPCVRVEIRLKRPANRRSENRGNCFGSDGSNRLKPCS